MSQGGELSDFGPSGMVRAIRYIVTRRLVILGGVCYATAFFSLLTLLSVAPLSIAVPATALGFVVDAIGARFLLRERVPWKRWAGVLCVTAGVILTVTSGAGSSRQWKAGDASVRGRDSGFVSAPGLHGEPAAHAVAIHH